MAAVTQGSAGEGPARLVSQSGVEKEHPCARTRLSNRRSVELSARYGFLLEEAFEMLCGLAKSQHRSVEEFADSIVRSGGRLDGDGRGDSGASLVSIQNGPGTASLSSELLIEAPSAASAFVLAGSLAEYGARAVVEGGSLAGRRRSLQLLLRGAAGCSRAHEKVARRSWSSDDLGDSERDTYRLDGSANGVGD